METIAFLGGGRIAGALIAGLHRGGWRGRIVVHDRHRHKLARLERAFGVRGERDARRAVEQADFVFVAVQPPAVEELLRRIGPMGAMKRERRRRIAVSLAAGVPLERLRRAWPAPVEWVRAMPSPASGAGRGLTALVFPRGTRRRTREAVRRLFGQLGEVAETSERRLDAFTVTYSPSHGYRALAALARAGEKLGLNRKTALAAAAHALGDGVALWRARRAPLARLLEEAATPGGIAAAMMRALDRAGYDRGIERALRAGLARARKYRHPGSRGRHVES
jgi:pyrroline-5-carboxylate reductase